MTTLDPGTLFLVGLIATIVAQLIKIVMAQFGWRPDRRAISLIAFALSMGLAVVFFAPQLPAGGDPFEFVKALLSAGSAIMGPATLIYNVIFEALLKAIGQRIGLSLTP